MNVDSLTYAACPQAVGKLELSTRYQFINGNVRDTEFLNKILAVYQHDVIYHLAAEQFVNAWERTYGLEAVTTTSSNNYGLYQHKEKVIPTVITVAINFEAISLYGNSLQQRKWPQVMDHVKAFKIIAQRGRCHRPKKLCIRSGQSFTDYQVVELICGMLSELTNTRDYTHLMTNIEGRLGRDASYKTDTSKTSELLGWKSLYTFKGGLIETVEWYLATFTAKRIA